MEWRYPVHRSNKSLKAVSYEDIDGVDKICDAMAQFHVMM